MAELLEVLRIWVVVDGEVGLHCAQLVVLEAGAHSLGAGGAAESATAAEPHLEVVRIQI